MTAFNGDTTDDVDVSLWRENEFVDMLDFVERHTKNDEHMVVSGSEADGYIKFFGKAKAALREV